MLFREVTRALIRRWYLLALGVVLALGSSYLVWTQTGSRYTAESTILLLPPLSATKGTAPNGRDGNPLLYLGGLGQARDVLISVMSSQSEQRAFDDQFTDATYTVAPDTMSSGPIIVLTVDTPTSELAELSIAHLSTSVTDRFKAMQAELAVKSDATIRSMLLTPPTAPEPDTKPQLRAAGVVGAGVLVLSLFLIALVDGLVRTRQRRLAAEASDADETLVTRMPSASSIDLPADELTSVDTAPEVATEDADQVPARAIVGTAARGVSAPTSARPSRAHHKPRRSLAARSSPRSTGRPRKTGRIVGGARLAAVTARHRPSPSRRTFRSHNQNLRGHGRRPSSRSR